MPTDPIAIGAAVLALVGLPLLTARSGLTEDQLEDVRDARTSVYLSAALSLVFFSGGLEPTINIWLAKITPERRRGFIFGWAASARSLGWMVAPLLSGLIAATLGLRYIYAVGAALFLLLIPLVSLVIHRLSPDSSNAG